MNYLEVYEVADSAFILEQMNVIHGALNAEYHGHLIEKMRYSVAIPAKFVDKIGRNCMCFNEIRQWESGKADSAFNLPISLFCHFKKFRVDSCLYIQIIRCFCCIHFSIIPCFKIFYQISIFAHVACIISQ